MNRVFLLLISVLLVSTGVVPAMVSAQNQTAPDTDQGSGGDGGISITSEIQKAITAVLMDSVTGLAETLNGLLVRIFVSYPEIDKSYVTEIHQKVFQVALALGSAAAAWIGILHILNRVDGVRPLIYLLGSLAVGAVAPALLYYPIELSRLTTEALAPANPEIVEVSRFTFELFLVLLVDVFLLLGTVMIFLARDVFLLTGVVLAPLIALMATTPTFRRFADRLISIWLACLLIGPLDVVVLDLTLSLMGSFNEIPHYLWGLAGIALLFGLPLILLGAGAFVFAPMTRVVSKGAGKAWAGRSSWKQVRDTEHGGPGEWSKLSGSEGRGNRDRRRGDDRW